MKKKEDIFHKIENKAHADSKLKYYCPMHCEGDKTYDKPGNCPVWGMHLQNFYHCKRLTTKFIPELRFPSLKDSDCNCKLA